MNQTLKKIQNIVTLTEVTLQKVTVQEVNSREVATPNAMPTKVDFAKRIKLQTIVTQHTIPKSKIAERAFAIWQERGCGHGNDHEDWLLAQIQLEDELMNDELN